MYLNDTFRIEYKYIFINLFYAGVILILGSILKDGIAVLPIIGFTYFLSRKNLGNLILFLVLWVYIERFFCGQGLITNSNAIKLMSSKYYIFTAFILYFNKYNFKQIVDKRLLAWAILYILSLFLNGFVNNDTIGIGTVIAPYFIYLYFLIQIPKNIDFSKRFFNLLLAIVLLQLIVSVMQYTRVISPPISGSLDLYAGVSAVRSGIDDAAVGTMGSNQSNITSWLGTIVFINLISLGLHTKETKFSIFAFIFLIQYTLVDSKIMLGVTIIGTILFLLRSNLIKLIFSKNMFLLLVLFLGGIGLKEGVSLYYNNNYRGVDSIIENILQSTQIITSDISKWGKFIGFTTLYSEFASESWLTVLIGNGNSIFADDSTVRMAISSDMSRNNFTNSLSAWIALFSNTGVIGILLGFSILLILYQALNRKNFCDMVSISIAKACKILVLLLGFAMFIYIGLSLYDLAFNLLFMFIALAYRLNAPRSDMFKQVKRR